MCRAWEEIKKEWQEAAKESGMEQGLEQGLEQGIEQGKALGRIQAVLNMIDFGISKEKILTKYTMEEYNMAERQLILKN